MEQQLLQKAQSSFQLIFDGLQDDQKASFMRWIFETTSQAPFDSLAEKIHTAEEKLSGIITDLRAALPINGVLESEKIIFPTFGEHADCKPEHTVHIDAFLYDDWALDQLCDEGKVQRNYCKDCGSRNVLPLTFISHSMSKRRLQYIFLSLATDLEGKTVVDIGSRLGTVLYGAYVYSNAAKIIGIEMNPQLCDVQKTIVKKHGLEDRIQVVSSDVRHQGDVLKKADVVVIHSVTDFFLPQEEHSQFWTYIRENVNRSGVKLITTPSLEKSLLSVKPAVELAAWVKPVTPSEGAEFEAAHDPDLAELNVYECV